MKKSGYDVKAIIIIATNFLLKNDETNIERNIADSMRSDVMKIRRGTLPIRFILKTGNVTAKKNREYAVNIRK